MYEQIKWSGMGFNLDHPSGISNFPITQTSIEFFIRITWIIYQMNEGFHWLVNVRSIFIFVHRFSSTCFSLSILQTAIFTIFVVPCRLFILITLLLLAWMLASIGLYGLTMEDINAKPITGWRRWELTHFIQLKTKKDRRTTCTN